MGPQVSWNHPAMAVEIAIPWFEVPTGDHVDTAIVHDLEVAPHTGILAATTRGLHRIDPPAPAGVAP
ncbi:hypothetical protein ACWIGI_09630 [Nocardia sp. NPDC055321]